MNEAYDVVVLGTGAAGLVAALAAAGAGASVGLFEKRLLHDRGHFWPLGGHFCPRS